MSPYLGSRCLPSQLLQQEFSFSDTPVFSKTLLCQSTALAHRHSVITRYIFTTIFKSFISSTLALLFSTVLSHYHRQNRVLKFSGRANEKHIFLKNAFPHHYPPCRQSRSHLCWHLQPPRRWPPWLHTPARQHL